MNRNNSKLLKAGCYFTSFSMSVVANLSPILFITFRKLYDISYSQLGLLVLINFVSQLSIDLIFSFFSHRFNISKTVKLTPVVTLIGLALYSISPYIFKDNVYAMLVLATVIFSAGSGLAEVLISPVVAALPSDDPDREMSKLHSVYAWGTVVVIIVSTLFLSVFGGERWQLLAMLFLIIPLTASLFLAKSVIPKIDTPEKSSGALSLLTNKGLLLSVLAIFLGGASECTMAQWCSGYLEKALSIPKLWGDIAGVAVFSLTLGLGRTLYSKFGKNVGKVIFFGGIGATICYLVASISSIPFLGLLACGLTGFFTSMLWPGNLAIASERFPLGGVFVFAIMAAGGDLGASVGPQLVGIVTDITLASEKAAELAISLGITAEQLGMKLGMLTGMLFPLASIPVYYRIWKYRKK